MLVRAGWAQQENTFIVWSQPDEIVNYPDSVLMDSFRAEEIPDAVFALSLIHISEPTRPY